MVEAFERSGKYRGYIASGSTSSICSRDEIPQQRQHMKGYQSLPFESSHIWEKYVCYGIVARLQEVQCLFNVDRLVELMSSLQKMMKVYGYVHPVTNRDSTGISTR